MTRPRGPLRTWFRGAIAAMCAVLALTACTSVSQPKPRPVVRDPRPNIVFVLTDDLSPDLLQYMPHVQALEQAGTSFSHYFVVDSLCCPSRSAIFTGQYPHNNGVFTNTGSDDGGYRTFTRLGDEKRTFAVALQHAGYRTAFMGKYLNGYFPIDRKPPGWDDFAGVGNGYFAYNYVLNDNGTLHRYGHAPKDYLTDVLSQKADKFVSDAAQQRKPFALEVATFAPHRPAVPAPMDRNSFPTLQVPRGPAFDRPPINALNWLSGFPPLTPRQIAQLNLQYERRVESVQAVDRLVGHLQAKLRAKGLLSNTYFVFSSDNGYHMGQHGLTAGKQTAFDTDIRVPLIVSGPRVPAGTQVSALASSIDLTPTFEALAGAKPVGNPDGTSLLSMWHGSAAPADWQQAVLIEHHHGSGDTAGDPDAQTPRHGDPPSYEAIRTGNSIYVEYDNGEREYYNLATDPYELDNTVSSLTPAQLADLSQTLHRLRECHGTTACQAAARVG